ncbi:hypothetical protein AWW67_08575 [Roseivirga seohaensis]|uniref:Uncharacterized protein n=2 Tax=Roseivirga seohaensis TaxID=1914963 RepID=A0A150XQ62_9BACT|nr:hypothetical protein AWW67_08575 [Roseivirga seohaensis]
MDLNMPMMRLVILPLILALLCLPQITNACECAGIDDAVVKRLIEKYDYVFVGSAIEVLHPDDEKPDFTSNESKGGMNVIFEIDSVIKGESKLKTVIVNQFGMDSCNMWFKLGEKYIVVGKRIDKLNWNRVKKGDFPYWEEQPPILGYRHSLQILGNRKEYRYWKRLARRNTIITTDMCSTFRVGTEDANLFLK